MKILSVGTEEYEAERIVKKHHSIMGYIDGLEVFCFNGISDFSPFILNDGESFDLGDLDSQVEFNVDIDFRLSIIEMGL